MKYILALDHETTTSRALLLDINGAIIQMYPFDLLHLEVVRSAELEIPAHGAAYFMGLQSSFWDSLETILSF